MYLVVGGTAVLLVIILMVTGIAPGLLTDAEKGGSFSMWGLESNDAWKKIIEPFNAGRAGNTAIDIRYSEMNEATVETNLINVLASSKPPDLLVVPSTMLTRQKNKFRAAPVGILNNTTIQANYSDAVSFFQVKTASGPTVMGIPIYGDALMLYSNNDILSRHLIPNPPVTWDDFLTMARETTEKDRAGNIIVSGAAMGRADNISHADRIMEALFLQFGEPIITESGKVVFAEPNDETKEVVASPAASALQFFLDFGNPRKTSYTWSSTLPEARTLFLNGKLTFYIGFMSEYKKLITQNPHLDIRVSMIPQLARAPRPVTTGTMYALMVPARAQNSIHAWTFASYMTNQWASEAIAQSIGLMPPLRGTVLKYKSDPVKSVFANSVFAMKLWQNPAPEKVRTIFKSMIQNASSNRDSLTSILSDTRARLREAQ